MNELINILVNKLITMRLLKDNWFACLNQMPKDLKEKHITVMPILVFFDNTEPSQDKQMH